MLERIVAQFALALFSWLEKRIDREKTARDATPDIPRLRRAGARIREWVLSANQVEIPEGWYCVPPSFVKDDAAGSP